MIGFVASRWRLDDYLLRAARGEGGHEVVNAKFTDTRVTGSEQDRDTTGTKLSVRVAKLTIPKRQSILSINSFQLQERTKYSRSQRLGNRALIRAVASGQDLRRRVLVEEVIDDVQESLELSILVIISNGDEGDGDVSGETNRVLNVEVLEARSGIPENISAGRMVWTFWNQRLSKKDFWETRTQHDHPKNNKTVLTTTKD